jgi:TPR repeat protein
MGTSTPARASRTPAGAASAARALPPARRGGRAAAAAQAPASAPGANTPPTPPDDGAPGGAAASRRLKQALKDARIGAVEAQYEVALMYANGVGTAQDLGQALEWMSRAAERGHAGAQYMLGAHYAAEPGTARADQADDAQAFQWLFRAAQHGHPRAHHRLARLLGRAHATLAAAYDAKAATLGVPEAQLALGQAQQRTDPEAVAADGLAWLRRAAEQGLAAAQGAFGCALLDGRGVAADRERGLHWLGEAARQQWPPAIVRLHAEGALAPDAAATGANADPGGSKPSTASPPRPGTRPAPRPAGAQERSAPAQPEPADPVDAQARHDLGLMWEHGIGGVGPDPQQALHWYALAADQGLAQAHAALARLLEPGDADRALVHYRQAAEGGVPSAQAALGRLLGGANRSATERLEARSWLARAAYAGDPEALLACATQWETQDPELARHALQRAAEAGLAEAQARHARQLRTLGGRTAAREAFEWNRLAAAQGHPGARCAMGQALRDGDGVPKDLRAAEACLREAADAGDARARWSLALLLAAGTPDTPRDLVQAMASCRQAADAGFIPAKATMGVLCTAVGRPDEAVRWWREAAAQGDLEAQYNLAQALSSGRGAPADPVQAFDLYRQAAEGGLVAAQARLGILYASGIGVVADPVEASRWFFTARLGGDADAARNAERSRSLWGAAVCEEGERRGRQWRASRR